MGKEAKIGLAIVGSLLIILGGVVAWRMRSASAAAKAQAAEEQKDKSSLPGESAAGKADAGSGEYKPRHKREPRELAKVVSPSAGSGHAPKIGDGDNDSWNVASDYRNPRNSDDEATAIAPPPQSMMPRPPMPENRDPRDRYSSKRGPAIQNPYLPSEPPADAAALDAAAEPDARQHKNPFDALVDEQNQTQGNEGSGDAAPPDVVQAGSAPDLYGAERENNDPRRSGQNANRYGANSANDRPSSNHRNQQAGAGSSYNRKKPAYGNYGKSGEQDYLDAGLRDDGTYDVQPNDSFWTISEKKYKTGAYYKALEELNRGRTVDGQLKVGQNLLLPEAAELEKKYPSLCPKTNHREVLVRNKNNGNIRQVSGSNIDGSRSYTVAEGDTLFDIARYELGKASRWAEIYELNKSVLGKDFDYLIPGTQLTLPSDTPDRPDPVAQRPEKGKRRY